MRRVLDGLVWVFLAGLVGGSFWYFSERGESEAGAVHSASAGPGHLERVRSYLYYLGRAPQRDPWTPTAATSGLPVR